MSEDDAVQTIIQAFGGRIVEKIHTQKARIMWVLADNQWHTTLEIRERAYGDDHLSMARIAARMFELKKAGHQIESRRKQGTVWEYRLISKV